MTNKEAAEFIWDVLDGVKSFNEEGDKGLEALDLAIKALKNERPQGEWKIKTRSTFPQYQPDEYLCPFCNTVMNYKTNFCPNCGAKMQKGGAE